MVGLVVLLLRLVLAGELCKVLELRGSESGGRAGLEGATEEQLGRKQRSEVHVETGAWSLQVVAVLVARVESAGVDRHVVRPLRVPVAIAGLVRREGAVRKAVMTAAVHLPVEARLETGSAGSVRGALVLLHTEKMRGQTEAVPRALR